MSILMTFRIALKALNRNKMRTALTMLGMIIGVAAVITMVALGSGAQTTVEQQIQTAGTNVITVNPGSFMMGGVHGGMGASGTLTAEDAEALRDVPGVRYVVPGANSRQQVVYGNQNWFTRINGTDVDLPFIRSWTVQYGTFFSSQDVASSAKVAVLGATVRDQLFGEGEDPAGQVVRVRNQPFKVVGVLNRKGQAAMGEDQDDAIYVPFTTVMKKLQRNANSVQNITVSAESADNLKKVADAIAAELRVRHKIQEGDSDDFMVRTLEEMASLRLQIVETMTYLLASIASVSLLVGGIGIMNIMLVSVTERTREIGLRMSIGARGRDVLLQFLVEAVVLSLLGGCVGILLGFGVSRGLTQFFEWPTTIESNAVGVAFGFAAAIGVFFGFYPARKAAGLDPIEALRYE